MRAGVALLAGVFAASALAGCSTPPTPPEELAREMFDLSNAQREEAGLAPLTWSDCLADKAAERAAPFVDSAELEHEVLVSSCHEGAKAGENLSRTDLSAADVVDLWMGSAGHRANILDSEFTIGAVACVAAAPNPDGGDSGVRACSQLFEGPEPS
ncbi:CAP domain-containing protein [Demequina sp. SYSU T00192]|uniref:CAP domain-containing protein n=1 Tax=Demequina litoralis TaxID=3051660 RepID=A0ABT8G8D9_9MICO|nr:CAP domain-containing protein [Demequina sp. SYSU T00192]MDN4475401.1 CAP domain-containing protein [Demequina sp. SYSU T00192]